MLRRTYACRDISFVFNLMSLFYRSQFKKLDYLKVQSKIWFVQLLLKPLCYFYQYIYRCGSKTGEQNSARQSEQTLQPTRQQTAVQRVVEALLLQIPAPQQAARQTVAVAIIQARQLPAASNPHIRTHQRGQFLGRKPARARHQVSQLR